MKDEVTFSKIIEHFFLRFLLKNKKNNLLIIMNMLYYLVFTRLSLWFFSIASSDVEEFFS